MSSVSFDPLFALEDLIARCCGATIVSPRARTLFRAASTTERLIARRLEGLLRRSFGIFEESDLPKKTGPEMALSLGIQGYDLEAVTSVRGYRERFDLLTGYIFDAWGDYPECARNFDHLFFPLPEVLGDRRRLGASVALLPLGVDALAEGCDDDDRPIDVFSYGRIPPRYRAAFSERFNRPDSKRLFLRAEPRAPLQFPSDPYEARSDRADGALLYQLLRRSKASLCFDTLYPGMRTFPYSFVTLRWFDAFAAGCAAVGKRPTTTEADRLMPWPDAGIELPEDPERAGDFLEALLSDSGRLRRIRLRNHYESLARHDWRLRIRDMWKHIGLEVPSALARELELLEDRAAMAKSKAIDAGAL